MAIRRLIIGNKDVFFKERITGSVWKSPTGKTGLTLQACHCPCKISHWNTLKVMFNSLSGYCRNFVNGKPAYTCSHNRTRVNIGGVQPSIPASASFNKVWQADIIFNVHSVSSCKLSRVLPTLISTRWI